MSSDGYIKVSKFVSSHDAALVAVSKTRTAGQIMEIYNLGQRIFGENRVQELLVKKLLLPADIEWHLIGHLQKNKVKQLLPHVKLIHSADSIELLSLLNEEAEKQKLKVNVLLQVKIAQEESKYGFSLAELKIALTIYQSGKYPHIVVRGLMGMASLTPDREVVRSEFAGLHKIYMDLIESSGNGMEFFNILSMGMSGDYDIAIEEGANMVRIGSLLFQ
ncbi:MAG: YggS family pyridoxal phosphate-dependent enzyme [Saprospiraceae bacterium]|nr:YggS family pyridoxal phosphate-dependent enzyme [Saprospiraceae bacterium]